MTVYLLNPGENPLISNLLSRVSTYGFKKFSPKYTNLVNSLYALNILGAIVTDSPSSFLNRYESIPRLRNIYINKWACKYPNSRLQFLKQGNLSADFHLTDTLLLTSKCVVYRGILKLCQDFPGNIKIVLDDHIHVYESQIRLLSQALGKKVSFLRPLGSGRSEILFPDLQHLIDIALDLPPIGVPLNLSDTIIASKRNGRVLSVGSITLQDVNNTSTLELYQRHNISCPHPDRLWLLNHFNAISCLDSISYVDDQRTYPNDNIIERLSKKLFNRINKYLYYSKKLAPLFQEYTYVMCPSNFYGVVPQLIFEAMSNGAIIIAPDSPEYLSLGLVNEHSFYSISSPISARSIELCVKNASACPEHLDQVQLNSLQLLTSLQYNSSFSIHRVKSCFNE